MPSTRRGRANRRFAGPMLLAVTLAAATACAPGSTRPRAAMLDARIQQGPSPGQRQQHRQPTTLTVDNRRGSGDVIAAGTGDAVYNYAPTLLLDDGQVHMWWCSQYAAAAPAGDDILYAVADGIDGPYRGPDGAGPAAVLSGQPGEFDAVHTCDPSVIKVGGTYYMYYTGSAGDRTHGNAIGLATSTDGVHWTRAAGGAPIVRPAHDTHRDNVYGTGQPAAVYLDGWFYLMFTDTTGADAGWNGAGQFVLRSKDPAFTGGVQALGPQGFVPVPDASSRRTRSVVDAFSVDLMWVDALQAFAIAHETAKGTTITFYDRGFTRHPYEAVLLPGRWEEGPGLLRQAQGHAPTSAAEPCGRVPVDVVRATAVGKAGAPTGLRHFGLDLVGVDGCGSKGRALAVLDGYAMPSPMRTMDLVAGGKLVRVQRRSVAEALAGHVIDRRPKAVEELPVSARIDAGAPVLRTGEGRVGLLLDGTLWPVHGVGAAKLAELNDSPLRTVTSSEWAGYRVGPALGS